MTHAARLELHLLGGFRVVAGGTDVADDEWRRRKAKALVKLLALADRHEVPREQAAELLWPGLAAGAAEANLRKAAHKANRVLAPLGARAVESREGRIRLSAPGGVWVDANAFRALARTGAWEEALRLYRGDLLPEDRYEDWAAVRREELRITAVELLLGAARSEHAAGDAGRAIELAQRALAAEPGNEEAHRLLIELYVAAGSRHRALRQYQLCREALRRELDADPSPETEAVYEALRARSAGERIDRSAAFESLPPLVGREAERERLEQAWDDVLQGAARVVVVSGEAGIGKTRLAQEMARNTVREGGDAVVGTAAEAEGALAFAPIVEALRLLLERWPGLAADLPPGARADLGRLLPELGEPRLPFEDAQLERVRLFASIAQLAVAAARERPLALVVEDLHAADEATLALFGYLARVVRRHRVLLLGTYRAGAEPGALTTLLAQLLERRLGEEVRLGPLTELECGRLVEQLVEGQVAREPVAQLHAACGGNPFFLEELVLGLREQGALRREEGRWRLVGHVLPERLRRTVALRVELLGEPARAVLGCAALVGREFRFEDVEAASGASGRDALDALDAALAAQLLEERSGHYRFRHELVREALVDSLSDARRKRLHRALGEHLAAQGRVVEAGYQLARSETPERAAPLLERVGDEAAALGALRDAAARYDEAASLVPEEESPEWARLLEKAGDALAVAGDAAAAAARFREAAAGAPVAASLRRKAARGLLAAGRLDEAREECELASRATASGEEEAHLLLLEGLVAWHGGDLDSAQRSGQEARAVGESRPDRGLVAEAAALLALVAHSRGGWERGLSEEIERLAGDEFGSAPVLDAQLCLAEYQLYGTRPYEDARRFAGQLLGLARQRRNGRAEAFAACFLGEVELLAGALDEAEPNLSAAAALASQLGAAAAEALALQRLGELALLRGSPEEARARAGASLVLAERSPLRGHLYGRGYGTLVAALGRVSEAVEALEQGVELASRGCPTCSAPLFVAGAAALAAAGDAAGAEAFARRAKEAARMWAGGAWAAAAEEACGWAAYAAARFDDAADHFARARDGFCAAGQPLDERRLAAALTRLGAAAG